MPALNIMFMKNANAAFNTHAHRCRIIQRMDMHEQMQRLYQAARELRDTEGQTEVAKLLGASPQTLNNWENRGISNQGLLLAQEIIGCDAGWLRDGKGNMLFSAGKKVDALADVAELVKLFAQSSSTGKTQILKAARLADKEGGL